MPTALFAPLVLDFDPACLTNRLKKGKETKAEEFVVEGREVWCFQQKPCLEHGSFACRSWWHLHTHACIFDQSQNCHAGFNPVFNPSDVTAKGEESNYPIFMCSPWTVRQEQRRPSCCISCNLLIVFFSRFDNMKSFKGAELHVRTFIHFWTKLLLKEGPRCTIHKLFIIHAC